MSVFVLFDSSYINKLCYVNTRIACLYLKWLYIIIESSGWTGKVNTKPIQAHVASSVSSWQAPSMSRIASATTSSMPRLRSYSDRGCCYLDEGQTRLVMKSNLQFRLESPEEQFFHEFFTPATSDQEGQWMTAAAIFQEMKSKVGSSLRIANIRTFGRFLSNLDSLTRRRSRYGTEYLVAKR